MLLKDPRQTKWLAVFVVGSLAAVALYAWLGRDAPDGLTGGSRVGLLYGIAGGLLTRLSAVGLMIVMLGAMHRKAFVWHSGFWGKGSQGWHYDLLLFLIALLVFATNGGVWTIDRLLFGSQAASSYIF